MSTAVFYIDSAARGSVNGRPNHSEWQDTGITLNQNQAYDVTCQGKATPIYHYPNTGAFIAGPEGGGNSLPDFLAPNLQALAAIAKIGKDGTPFFIGKGYDENSTLISRNSGSESGKLFLAYNDSLANDNMGGFFANIHY
ncbi:MAG: hypothetical protein JKY48_16875 [Flavobacteriales bacterium]|nr:hypothetical protein [Flavobacteriales bacterium]